MKKIKLITLLATVGLSTTFVLAGCGADVSKTDSDKIEHTTQGKKYSLVYVDTASHLDSWETTNDMVIGFLKDNKVVKITLPMDKDGNLADGYEYNEHILSNSDEKPYVTVNSKSGTINVYRQPYVTYAQPDLSGTVTDKSTNN